MRVGEWVSVKLGLTDHKTTRRTKTLGKAHVCALEHGRRHTLGLHGRCGRRVHRRRHLDDHSSGFLEFLSDEFVRARRRGCAMGRRERATEGCG